MTVAGPAIGSALFAYGKFGDIDANYLRNGDHAVPFTLIPYALVLLQLRVFYARDDPWTPILDDRRDHGGQNHCLADGTPPDRRPRVGGRLPGHRQRCRFPRRGGARPPAAAPVAAPAGRRVRSPARLWDPTVVRTVLATTAASVLAALVAGAVDRFLGLDAKLTVRGGGAGSMLRLLIFAAVMLPVLAAVMLAARVPDALAAWRAVQRRIPRRAAVAASPANSHLPHKHPHVTYPESGRTAQTARRRQGKGPDLSDQPPGAPPPGPDDVTTHIPRRAADDFRPDVAGEPPDEGVARAGGYDTRGAVPLAPGATVANGRYRLLVSTEVPKPAVLAGPGHLAGPTGRAHLRRPRPQAD